MEARKHKTEITNDRFCQTQYPPTFKKQYENGQNKRYLLQHLLNEYSIIFLMIPRLTSFPLAVF